MCASVSEEKTDILAPIIWLCMDLLQRNNNNALLNYCSMNSVFFKVSVESG